MSSKKSKKISKTDEEAKELIIETLEEEETGGFDVDSIYHMPNGDWIVIEFLKCDTVKPSNSHPNRYWFKNKQKFISLWELTQELNGKLFLINYEDSREEFKKIYVKEIDLDEGITDEEIDEMDFEEFKEWFKELNSKTLQ